MHDYVCYWQVQNGKKRIKSTSIKPKTITYIYPIRYKNPTAVGGGSNVAKKE